MQGTVGDDHEALVRELAGHRPQEQAAQGEGGLRVASCGPMVERAEGLVDTACRIFDLGPGRELEARDRIPADPPEEALRLRKEVLEQDRVRV